MEKKKVLIVVGGLAAVTTALYFIFKPQAKQVLSKLKSLVTGEEPVVGSSFTNSTAPVFPVTVKTDTTPGYGKSITGCPSYKLESFPIGRGMKGTNVKAIQTILNELYYSKTGVKLTVDGCFGPLTESTLVKATGKKTLTQDEYLNLAKAGAAIKNMDI